MHLGKTISYLRKQKGISVNELCNNKISRQAYNKFVNGKSVTSIETFRYFLDVLCVEFDEFFLIHNNFHNEFYIEIMSKINRYFTHSEGKKIYEVREELASKINTGDKKLIHLFFISDLFLSRLTQQPFNHSSVEKLKEYFLSIEIWTIYEIELFNNSIFCFKSETINFITKKVSINFNRLLKDDRYKNKIFLMLLNVCIHFITLKEIENIITYLDILKKIELPEEALYEKLCLILIDDLISLYYGNHKKETSIKLSLDILNEFNAKKVSEIFTNLYSFVRDSNLNSGVSIEK